MKRPYANADFAASIVLGHEFSSSNMAESSSEGAFDQECYCRGLKPAKRQEVEQLRQQAAAPAGGGHCLVAPRPGAAGPPRARPPARPRAAPPMVMWPMVM